MQHRLAALATPLAALILVSACGDDKGTSASSTTTATTTASSYQIVSDADVKTGYTDLITLMTTLSADPTSVDETKLDAVEAKWSSFEGTVKQNEPDLYLASEEALDSFNQAGLAKDAAGLAAATTKMSTTAAAYLSKHPA